VPISTRCRCPTGRCSARGGSRVSYEPFGDSPRLWSRPAGAVRLSCNYCPYIVVENAVRARRPEKVVTKSPRAWPGMAFDRSSFRDPLFGLDRSRTLELAARLARLKRPVQFSIESRLDLLREDTLRALRSAGLTSITFGIETPDEATLRRYRRAPVRDDRQRDFIELCRRLAIRTVAGFMIGFPGRHRRADRIGAALRAGAEPHFANFKRRDSLPGHGVFCPGEARDRRFRLLAVQRLQSGAEIPGI